MTAISIHKVKNGYLVEPAHARDESMVWSDIEVAEDFESLVLLLGAIFGEFPNVVKRLSYYCINCGDMLPREDIFKGCPRCNSTDKKEDTE